MGAREDWAYLQYPRELKLSKSQRIKSQCPGDTNIEEYRKVNGQTLECLLGFLRRGWV